MTGIQSDGVATYLHYDVHNIYGYSETIATYNALAETVFPGKRPFVLSRSTFPGSGKYAAHWLGDNTADWVQLKMSIIGTIEFNMFGIPFVGPDVCGFYGEPSEELCIRWMQLGAFLPFDRNHNTLGTADQDPAKPGWEQCPVISREVLLLRYKYIPYMYSKIFDAYLNGFSVIRPLYSVFPTDLDAREVTDQFMWGTELMVAPVVEEGAIDRNVYFPNEYFYDLVNGTLVSNSRQTKNVQAPLDKIPVYVKGGSILQFQLPALTTTDSRTNPFGLTIALDYQGYAIGYIHWDDGISKLGSYFLARMTFNNNTLNYGALGGPTLADGLMFEIIQIYGYSSNPSEIDVNGVPADSSSWDFDSNTKVLTFNLTVPVNQSFKIYFIFN